MPRTGSSFTKNTRSRAGRLGAAIAAGALVLLAVTSTAVAGLPFSKAYDKFPLAKLQLPQRQCDGHWIPYSRDSIYRYNCQEWHGRYYDLSRNSAVSIGNVVYMPAAVYRADTAAMFSDLRGAARDCSKDKAAQLAIDSFNKFVTGQLAARAGQPEARIVAQQAVKEITALGRRLAGRITGGASACSILGNYYAPLLVDRAARFAAYILTDRNPRVIYLQRLGFVDRRGLIKPDLCAYGWWRGSALVASAKGDTEDGRCAGAPLPTSSRG